MPAHEAREAHCVQDRADRRPPPYQVSHVEERIQRGPDGLDGVFEVAVLEPVPAAVASLRQHLSAT